MIKKISFLAIMTLAVLSITSFRVVDASNVKEEAVRVAAEKRMDYLIGESASVRRLEDQARAQYEIAVAKAKAEAEAKAAAEAALAAQVAAEAKAKAEAKAAAEAAARRQVAARASRSTVRSAPSGDIAACIRKYESGGNYQAQNRRSSASGAYQFLDGTWHRLTGLPGSAKDYPVDVQDAAFWKLWNGGSGARQWLVSGRCGY